MSTDDTKCMVPPSLFGATLIPPVIVPTPLLQVVLPSLEPPLRELEVQIPFIPTKGDVSPGEVCTIDTAKNLLGITNLADIYNQPNFKTFRSPQDNGNISVCVSSRLDSNVAYPHCIIQAGVGFSRKATDGRVCETLACPFLSNVVNTDGTMSTVSTCDKNPVLVDYKKDKRNFCEERWYDWFTIPNYHLGNSFSNVPEPGKPTKPRCFKPCPSGQVPLYAVDPVTSSMLPTGEAHTLDACVLKSQYLGGKYANSDDQCPLALIHRISMKKSDIEQKLRNEYNTFSSSNSVTTDFRSYTTPDKIRQEAARTFEVISNGLSSNVQVVSSTQTNMACDNLANLERLRYAYSVCSNMQYDPNYAKEITQHLLDPTSTARVLKQSCSSLFCNPDNAAFIKMTEGTSGAQPPATICFTDILDTVVEKTYSDPYDRSLEKSPIKVKEFVDTLPKALKIMIWIMFVPLILFVVYMVLTGTYYLFRKVRRSIRNVGVPETLYNIKCTLSKFFTNKNCAPYFGTVKANETEDLEDMKNEMQEYINYKNLHIQDIMKNIRMGLKT